MSVYRHTLVITNNLTCLPQVRELVRTGVEQVGFCPAFLNRLQIAVDEAVTNIIEHGYQDKKPGSATIELKLRVDRDCFRIEIEDYGMTFDPDKLADIDIETHVAAGRTGGLGVFLMRRIMDVIEYHYENGKKNQLVLVKYKAPG